MFPELKNQSAEAFVLFDEFGNLLNQRGDISMPISLGIIGPLDVDAIPSPCPTTWSTKAVRPMSIGSADEDKTSGVALIPCEERCTYRVTGVNDAAVTLEKRYTLATPGGRDGPLLKIAGEGTVTLHRAQGGLKTSELTATITVNADGKQEEIPLAIRTKTQFAPREADRAAAATPEERRAQENAASDKLDSLLAKLRDRTGRPFIYMSPLQNLEQMEPVESRRDEVLQVVRMHLDSSETLVLSLAIAAIGNWGDERNVEVLAEYLEHEESSVRRNAMVALGSIGGSKAAGVVAPLLGR